jgi:hypothetical protein
MHVLQTAGASLARNVLLSQARSVYLKDIPAAESDMGAAELELLMFKYGEAKLSVIDALKGLFGVGSALELDLVLQHELPILETAAFARFGPAVVSALAGDMHPGLRLLLTRFEQRQKLSGEIGHRSGFLIDRDGSCKFYDPSLGEMSFLTVADFEKWFAEYWLIERWTNLLGQGMPSSPPIRVFTFGGALSRKGREKSIALSRHIWQSARYREYLDRGDSLGCSEKHPDCAGRDDAQRAGSAVIDRKSNYNESGLLLEVIPKQIAE